MDYQEIVKEYKSKGLDISEASKKIEIAKPLSARQDFNILYLIGEKMDVFQKTVNLLMIPEKPEKVSKYYEDLENELSKYYEEIIKSISSTKAWKFLGMKQSENTLQKYKEFSINKKFSKLFEMNKKYQIFLEYQKLADIKSMFVYDSNVQEDDIRKIVFVDKMFHTIENEEAKREFFCFDEAFLKSLVDFKKSKDIRIEEFMKKKRKSTQYDYNRYSNFFTTEDYRDIAECLIQTSKTLKVNIKKVIEYFIKISECETEIEYYKEEYQKLKELEAKTKEMDKHKKQLETEKKKQLEKEEKERKEKQKQEELENKKREEENKKKEAEEAKKAAELAAIKAERERIIGKTEGNTNEMDAQIEKQTKVITAKEQVNPLIFAWLENNDTSLARRIGNKKINEFFEKIGKIEAETGIRVSMFLVTNAGRVEALRRMQDFQKKAAARGFPRLIEGCLGGYSSFKIDATGKITDMAIMSDQNREKIMKLLETSYVLHLDRRIIDPTQTDYLRYVFSEKKDKSITKPYLSALAYRFLTDPKIKRQPIKLMPFIENNVSGIDVVLESQLKGISQLSEYYKIKYEIAPKKTRFVNIEKIDEFLYSQGRSKEDEAGNRFIDE